MKLFQNLSIMLNKKILAIDYGTKTLGIAISDNELKYAIPYIEINNDAKSFDKIKDIIDDEKVFKIVMGYPKTFNNYVSERHQMILDFKNNLLDHLNNIVEIVLIDESYSTIGAMESLKSFNVSTNKLKKNKDMIAASIILENYLKKQK